MALVLSCCRNNKKYIQKFRDTIDPIAARIILFENDSNDGTRESLESWACEDTRVTLILQDGLDKKFPSRTIRLAYCRNQLLARARDAPEEFTLVIDSDNVSQYMSGFDTNFKVTEPWDVLCVNTNYDTWALRSDACRVDCWKYVQKYSQQIGQNNALYKYIAVHQKYVDTLTKVKSAFGGAAFYKTKILKSSFYDGTTGCEHVPFHLRLKDCKIFINPDWKMCGPGSEHIVTNVYKPLTENDCEFVSSRGIAKRCFARNYALRSSCSHIDADILDDLYDGATLYLCNTSLQNFVINFLKHLKYKVVLYSGDSDETICVDNITSQIIESEYITKWYCQNCIFTHDKVVHLPIGLDYHTLFQNSYHIWGQQKLPIDQENEIRELPFEPQIYKCYSNWHFHLERGDRKEAFEKIPKHLIYYEPREITRLESHKRNKRYRFVASPGGGGPDCHRTWEALALGCVPIIKKTGLEVGLFDDLPVILINDWSEISEELFKQSVCTNLDKLKLNFWIK